MHLISRGIAWIERLVAALADPARRERTVAGVLVGYVLLWTLYGVLAKASQDVHIDMAEMVGFSREPDFGAGKHPPFAAAVAGAWFSIFPEADWSYYLLAVSVVGLALWFIWRILGLYLDGEKRVLGLALLTLVPFFNFHALKYNNNTVLILLWALATYEFLRSYESRRVIDAALAGVAAAATMYGKYWSVMLLAGLGIAALADRRRVAYFRSPAPYVTVIVGLLVLSPLVLTMVGSNFASVGYAYGIHGARSLLTSLVSAMGYLLAGAGYVAAPLIIVALAARPNRAALRDMAWPSDDRRRLAALAFWGPLLAPMAVAMIAHLELTGLWTMSAWALLPVMLLSSSMATVSHRNVVRTVAFAALFPLLMVLVAPVIAFAIHRAGQNPATIHSSLLAEPVDRFWRELTNKPLRLFSGYQELGYGTAFYLPSRPLVVHVLDGVAPPDLDQRVAREGIALVCPIQSETCLSFAFALAAKAPTSTRTEVEIARRFMGITGAPARYLIVVVPPRP